MRKAEPLPPIAEEFPGGLGGQDPPQTRVKPPGGLVM